MADARYNGLGLLLAWPSENVSPQTKRAVSSGMQIFVRTVPSDFGGDTQRLTSRPADRRHWSYRRQSRFPAFSVQELLSDPSRYLDPVHRPRHDPRRDSRNQYGAREPDG